MKTRIFIFLFATPLFVSGQLNNGNFETWDSTYVNVYSNILDSFYHIPDPVGGTVDHWRSSSGYGVSRTTDSYEGDFSLILHNWYGYAYEWMNYDAPIDSRPNFLTGYYKYNVASKNNLPHGYASVSLTKKNGNIIDTIGTAYHTFDSTSFYSSFLIPINYISTETPDSIHIYLLNGDRPCDTTIVCNFLYLDGLRLTEFPTSTDRVVYKDLVYVFPNPATDKIFLIRKNPENLLLTLYNSLGIKLLEEPIFMGIQSVDISPFPPAMYYYRVMNGLEEVETGKIFKQ